MEALEERALLAASALHAFATEVVANDPDASKVLSPGELVGVVGDENDTGKDPNKFPSPTDVIPMPIPDGSVNPGAGSPLGYQVTYDMATGKETIATTPSLPDPNAPMADFVPGSPIKVESGTESANGARNFGNIVEASNPSGYPARVNVKLIQTYPNGQTRGCSGTLIDPKHVITAGHCVFQSQHGGWARSVTVIPAYDDGDRPYGSAYAGRAHSTRLRSWEGWTVSKNYDWDVALVELNRPIGAITSWYGYGYNNSPSFFTGSNTFYNFSYPGDPPYDGQIMYYRSGDFDSTDYSNGSWRGNQVYFNKRSWGGQSGSSYYDIDGSSRIVYAITSNTTTSRTGSPRLNSTMFNDIGDWIDADVPSSRDLVPLDVSGTSTITAGSQLSSMSYLLHNYSSVSISGTVSVDVYLSTNDFISTSDQLIGSHTVSLSGLGSKSSTRVNVTSPPTIPSNMSTGNYWLGIIVSMSGDSITTNNDTTGDDAHPIRINALPDDAYEQNDTAGTAADPQFNGGNWEQTPLSAIRGLGVANDNDWYVINVTPGYHRLVIDATFSHSAGDIDMKLYNASGSQVLASATSISDNEHIDHIVDPAGGTYLIQVYPYSGKGNTYNLEWDDLQPPQTIDLLGTGFNVNPEPLRQGDSLAASVTISNAGNSSSGAFEVEFFLSRDNTIEPASDYSLGSYSSTAVAGGAAVSHTANLTLPPPGHSIWDTDSEFAIGMVIDRSDVVAETNESNNWNRGNLLDLDLVQINPASIVVDRKLFYNDSLFDGWDPSVNEMDDNAIAIDKSVLLPGAGAASFANFSSSPAGINGVMIDIEGTGDLAGLGAGDFVFRTGVANDTGSWTAVPSSPAIAVRLGEGTGGSDRIVLTWVNGAIVNTWLEVRVLANDNTGLVGDDIFYFGNQVGDSNGDGFTNANDFASVRSHPANFLNPARIDNPYDVNHDGLVNALDLVIVRDYATGLGNGLPMITPSDAVGKREITLQEADSEYAGSVLRREKKVTVGRQALSVDGTDGQNIQDHDDALRLAALSSVMADKDDAVALAPEVTTVQEGLPIGNLEAFLL